MVFLRQFIVHFYFTLNGFNSKWNFIWGFFEPLFGPAFLVLIETSIKKGFKSAMFLDIGILISDAVYLLAPLFIAEKINYWLYSISYILNILLEVYL